MEATLVQESNMRSSRLALAALLCSLPLPTLAQTPVNPAAGPILSMMQKSADDWNHGNLDAFATSYKNSPDILFIGHKISHGYAQMLAGYKAAYNTPAKMGTLTFTRLDVQSLDANFATVTGNFHLERTATGGGNADGYFLLVVENTAAGWKIVRDDTTALPATPPPAH